MDTVVRPQRMPGIVAFLLAELDQQEQQEQQQERPQEQQQEQPQEQQQEQMQEQQQEQQQDQQQEPQPKPKQRPRKQLRQGRRVVLRGTVTEELGLRSRFAAIVAAHAAAADDLHGAVAASAPLHPFPPLKPLIATPAVTQPKHNRFGSDRSDACQDKIYSRQGFATLSRDGECFHVKTCRQKAAEKAAAPAAAQDAKQKKAAAPGKKKARLTPTKEYAADAAEELQEELKEKLAKWSAVAEDLKGKLAKWGAVYAAEEEKARL